MSINEVVEILDNGFTFVPATKVIFGIALTVFLYGLISAFASDDSDKFIAAGSVAIMLGVIGLGVDALNREPNAVVVNNYIKSLDENKVYVSDIEKDKIRVTGVSSKKEKDYASVEVDGSNQNLGVFKTEMKVVSDVKEGDGAYITYKKLKKTLPGFYKKGWVNATLHVERGTGLMDLDKYVDANAGSSNVVMNADDRECGDSSKYVFVKEKGKLTIVCVGKTFVADNVFKGQTGEVLTYTSFKDAKEWLVENIKEDKIDPKVLEEKEAADNESFYK